MVPDVRWQTRLIDSWEAAHGHSDERFDHTHGVLAALLLGMSGCAAYMPYSGPRASSVYGWIEAPNPSVYLHMCDGLPQGVTDTLLAAYIIGWASAQEAVTQWCGRAVRLIPERPVQVI